MMNALPKNATLVFAGTLYQESLKTKFHNKLRKNKENIYYLGFLTRGEISTFYSQSIAGLVLLQYGYGYEETLPIKLFEYMAASLPVICSNFTFWQEVLVGCDCVFFCRSSEYD